MREYHLSKTSIYRYLRNIETVPSSQRARLSIPWNVPFWGVGQQSPSSDRAIPSRKACLLSSAKRSRSSARNTTRDRVRGRGPGRAARALRLPLSAPRDLRDAGSVPDAAGRGARGQRSTSDALGESRHGSGADRGAVRRAGAAGGSIVGVTERFAAAWWCAWMGSNPPWERKGVRNRFSRSADAKGPRKNNFYNVRGLTSTVR